MKFLILNRDGIVVYEGKADQNNRVDPEKVAMRLLLNGLAMTPLSVFTESKNSLAQRINGEIDQIVYNLKRKRLPLSERQKQVGHCVCQGLANKEIAERLHISVRTVKFHVSELFLKVGAGSRGELAVKMTRIYSNGGRHEKDGVEFVGPGVDSLGAVSVN